MKMMSIMTEIEVRVMKITNSCLIGLCVTCPTDENDDSSYSMGGVYQGLGGLSPHMETGQWKNIY